jgi:hypothetical protein
MKEFELKNGVEWTLLILFIFPFFWSANIVISELVIFFIVTLLFILNHKEVIIKNDVIYIEKYLWLFKKKYSCSVYNISHVNLNYLRRSQLNSSLSIYLKEKKKKENVSVVSDIVLKELYRFFKERNIPIETKTPDFFR